MRGVINSFLQDSYKFGLKHENAILSNGLSVGEAAMLYLREIALQRQHVSHHHHHHVQSQETKQKQKIEPKKKPIPNIRVEPQIIDTVCEEFRTKFTPFLSDINQSEKRLRVKLSGLFFSSRDLAHKISVAIRSELRADRINPNRYRSVIRKLLVSLKHGSSVSHEQQQGQPQQHQSEKTT